MGFMEGLFHAERKRQENWQSFSREAGGAFIVEGLSGGDEIHIPFMDCRIELSTCSQLGVSRTVLTSSYSSDEFQFKIFGWGGRHVPAVDRDPYLNSEFPDLAPKMKVEFNDSKKLTSLLASPELRHFLLEAPASFTLEAKPGLLSLDNRAHGSKEHGIITDLNHLHSALNLFKSTLYQLEAIRPASSEETRDAPVTEIALVAA